MTDQTPEKLYNPHDGLGKRDGGPYLDQIELEQAEIRRAKVEGREPDFENLQGTAGVRLVTAEELVKYPKKPENWIPDAAAMVDALADNPDVGPSPVGELPVEPAAEDED